MLYIRGFDGGAPTRRLANELRHLAPDLFTPSSRNRADLTLVPLRDDDCHADCWYELYWSHQQLEVEQLLFDESELVVRPNLISKAATIPAPPHIPAEQRLAAAPAVTLDGISDDHIRMCGGPAATLEILRARQRSLIVNDSSTDAYDWTALARGIATLIGTCQAPTLTSVQRAHVAAVRLWEAHRALGAARQSMVAHLGTCPDDDAYLELRRLVDAIDPAPVTR